MPRFPLLLLVLVVDFFSKAPPPGSDLDARIISVHLTASCNSIKRSEEKNDHQFHNFFQFSDCLCYSQNSIDPKSESRTGSKHTADRKSEAEKVILKIPLY